MMMDVNGWDWPVAGAGRETEDMFDENARLRGLDPRRGGKTARSYWRPEG